MSSIKRPVNVHQRYHAHVYFDAETLEIATQVCNRVAETFALKVGRVHQKPVGPHTMWSCQILFSQHDFDQLIPWLDTHRQGLSVLIHGDTGDDLADHTDYAYWLGDKAPLDLRGF